MVQQFSPHRIDRDDVWALIPKITARHQPEFDGKGTAVRRARLTVHLTDGSTLQRLVEQPRTIANPLTNAGVAAKYRTLTDGIIERSRQQAIEDCVMTLERANDQAALGKLLGSAVKSPFI